VALSGLAVVSCTAPPPAAEPAVGTIAVVRSAAEIVLPLDAYQLTADEQYTVLKASNALGRECMSRFGLRWPTTPPRVGGEAPVNARRYLVSDAEQVRTQGYHAVDALARHKVLAAAEAKLPPPSPEAFNVWSGQGERTYAGQPVPAGGCAGEATRRLTNNMPVTDPDLVQRLQLDTFTRTRTDSRVVAVFAAWSSCMKEHGYAYADPFAANDDQRWQTDKVSDQEITIAMADVACKARTKIVGTMFAVETAYQRRAITDHRAQLDDIRAYLTVQVGNASRVVTG
jgi:hypothetical protein